MARSVRELMTTRLVTVRCDEAISTAIERMTRYGFSALPVVTATYRLIGMVSLLDVLRFRELYEAEGSEADGHVRVEDIMNPDVLSMSATSNAAVVAHRLRSHGELRVMPVVAGGKLVGVITRSDLLRDRGNGDHRGWRLFVRDAAEQDALVELERERRTGPTPSSATPITEVMTHEVITVSPGDPVALAAELMLHHRHTALPVVDEGGLVGVVSEADILTNPLAGDAEHTTVSAVMTSTPITVEVDATAAQARALIADRGLRTVPVTDGERLAGVVSRSDLV